MKLPRKLKYLFTLCLIAFILCIGTSLQLNPVYTRQQNDTCDIFPEIIIQEKGTKIGRNDACNAEFCSTLEGNMRKIESHDFTKAEPYLHHLVPEKHRKKIWSMRNISSIELPVIVSGASSNHFNQTLNLIRNLKGRVFTVYKTEFFIFDLGLTTAEREKLKEICDCQLVDFPFSKFPEHVALLKAYCWKPLIIQLMLKEYNFVMWIDSSCRFITSELDPIFTKAKQNGVLVKITQMSLAAHIHQETFLFLREPPCLYRNYLNMQGGVILVHSEVTFVYEYIFQTWVKCALVEECMKTKHNADSSILSCPSGNSYHVCHRYDQVLILFVYRLFPESYRDFHIGDTTYYRFLRHH